ncbi:hypothetical protein IJJ37_02100 [Candidatus Saccharibacteria bacterium]|nr:hypothetical protein [Candidatus Saccharibacteria bacterium]
MLLGSLAGTLSAFADEPEPAAEKDYWTVEELIPILEQYKAEEAALCEIGDDECFNQLYETWSSARPEYHAVDRFRYTAIMMPEINPTNGTMSLYYRQEADPRWGIAEEPDFTITQLYLAWLDPEVPNPVWDLSWMETSEYPPYVNEIRAGDFGANTHYILHGIFNEYDAGIFPPSTIATFGISDSQIENNTLHAIQYTAYFNEYGSFNYNYNGELNYGSCFWNGYREGATCRLTFDKWGNYAYVADVSGLPELEANPDDYSAGLELGMSGYGGANDDGLYDGPVLTTSNDGSAVTLKAPDTGEFTTEETTSQGITWGPILLTLAAIAYTAWWFVPLRSQR